MSGGASPLATASATYVASRSLPEPPAWNATLLKGDLADSVPAIKDRHGLLIVSGPGSAGPRPPGEDRP